MSTTAVDSEVTHDRFLGGRVTIVQPRKGSHRAGSDAVFLAASVPVDARGHLVDLGAGVGTAGLCVAARVPGVTVDLVERDPHALACARAALALPEHAEWASRVRPLAVDITWREADRIAAGLARETADHVITNPPFWSAHAVRASIAPARVAAHVQDEAGLEPWIRAANAVLKPAGTLTLIYPAEGLDSVLALLPGRFGQALVFPLFPRAGQPAHRVLVRAIKGARPRLQIRQGLVLHGAEGSGWSVEADAINRDAAGLDLEA